MSLIHDALKSMDAPQEPKPAVVRAPAVAARGRPAWLDAVLAFAVVVGVGVLGWWLWQTQRQPQADMARAAAVPAVDDTQVELRFARFVVAMKESRSDDAERELAALRERLPAGSLGLLRAQAWFDLRAGRDAAAEGGYRAILERMPGDEEAAINLASIQSRQQKSEEARATLDAAARLQPDSAALRAALAQFTPMARQ